MENPWKLSNFVTSHHSENVETVCLASFIEKAVCSQHPLGINLLPLSKQCRHNPFHFVIETGSETIGQVSSALLFKQKVGWIRYHVKPFSPSFSLRQPLLFLLMKMYSSKLVVRRMDCLPFRGASTPFIDLLSPSIPDYEQKSVRKRIESLSKSYRLRYTLTTIRAHIV